LTRASAARSASSAVWSSFVAALIRFVSADVSAAFLFEIALSTASFAAF
jgi:hypothetical protein